MKRTVTLLSVCLCSSSLFAADKIDASRSRSDDPAVQASTHPFPLNPDGSAAITPMVDETWEDFAVTPPESQRIAPEAVHPIVPLAINLTYHGGDVINTARLVCIFWGPTWASGGSDNSRATTIQAFRDQFGTSSHYGIITQYYDANPINTTNLHGSQPDWFDTTSALPSNGNVSDSVVRAEVAVTSRSTAPTRRRCMKFFCRSTCRARRRSSIHPTAARLPAAVRASRTARTTAATPTARIT